MNYLRNFYFLVLFADYPSPSSRAGTKCYMNILFNKSLYSEIHFSA